jgi:ribosomal RNA-processing protein 36
MYSILTVELAGIDFGTLAKAQKSLSAPSKASSNPQKARSRIKPERPSKLSTENKPKSKSKNGPQEISSKKPVSRKHFLQLANPQIHKPRDPRFETLNNTVSQGSFRNAYSFLDKYQNDEISLLKEQIRTERDPDEKEKLRKTLQSLQSRRESQAAKKRAEEVLKERKREEKEKVTMGKKPFYLKKSMISSF